VNGDRRADILIGAPLASYSSRARGGSVYVVYGKAGGAPIDLAQLGPQGYRVDGDSAGLELGGQVAGPGDLNADRRPDALVSAVKGGARLVYSLFPIARTRAATADRSGARLRGTVDARGLSTTYFFEYGLTAVYGSRTSPREAGSGTGPVSVTAFLAARPERLRPGLTYHYRLVATNAFGPTYGQDGVFTVPR
jgi:hypothetical protein